MSRPRHTYNAHRRQSFVAADLAEQVEIRARLRTFDGAYSRTALASLGYSVLVLKLFDRRFYRIGLLYVILSFLLLIVQFHRRRHGRHDFADQFRPRLSSSSAPPRPRLVEARGEDVGRVRTGGTDGRNGSATRPVPISASAPVPASVPPESSAASQGKGKKKERVWGREFETAGWSVVAVTLIVGAVQVALFGLVCVL